MEGKQSDSELAGTPSTQYTPQLFQVQGEERIAHESAGTSMLLQLALNVGCTVAPAGLAAAPARNLLVGPAFASAGEKFTYSLLPMLLPALSSQETETLSPGSSALCLHCNVSGGRDGRVCGVCG
jgi:hypothetical protein